MTYHSTAECPWHHTLNSATYCRYGKDDSVTRYSRAECDDARHCLCGADVLHSIEFFSNNSKKTGSIRRRNKQLGEVFRLRWYHRTVFFKLF